MPAHDDDKQNGIIEEADGQGPEGSSDDSEKTTNIVSQVTAKSEPPPERPESIRVRTFVILSFWALVIFLGLPIWWKTTTIYRANLPLQQMMEWADGKACKPVFPLRISIEAPLLQQQEAQHLIRTTQHALDDLNDFSAHHLRLQLSQPPSARNALVTRKGLRPEMTSMSEEQEDIALVVRLRLGGPGPTPSAELQQYSPRLDVFYAPNQIPSTSVGSSPLASFIANKLQEIFAEEQAMIAYILSASNSGYTSPQSSPTGQTSQTPQSPSAVNREQRSSLIKSLPADLVDSLARRTTRSLKYSPTYHLTFSLFTPNAAPSSWAISSAITEYLTPLLESLSPISNFTIDTQVQLYATFSPTVQNPTYDPSQNLWTLRREDLSGFINAAEWPLSPSIGVGPTVNFVLYVPSPSTIPLVVAPNNGHSWLIPQWGGVSILNPPFPTDNNSTTHMRIPPHLPKEFLLPPLQIFTHQLLSLLGVPSTPPSLPLRLLTLSRVRSASLLLSASSTLGSLARLALALPSISIPQSVASSVDLTLNHLNAACSDLREGKFESALYNARISEREAEKGFFEKSMVGQVYFPDEHKVAVYLPLLGPVGVPLVMGLLKEGRRVWRGWRGGRP
ncbi:MAG: GPI transamidase component [Candelina mexicana]|nr:MAG: GPI transamidase component [Candelina mexicana]